MLSLQDSLLLFLPWCELWPWVEEGRREFYAILDLSKEHVFPCCPFPGSTHWACWPWVDCAGPPCTESETLMSWVVTALGPEVLHAAPLHTPGGPLWSALLGALGVWVPLAALSTVHDLGHPWDHC